MPEKTAVVASMLFPIQNVTRSETNLYYYYRTGNHKISFWCIIIKNAEIGPFPLIVLLKIFFLWFSFQVLDRRHICHIFHSFRKTTKSASRLPAPPSMTVMTGVCHIKKALMTLTALTTSGLQQLLSLCRHHNMQSKDHNRTPLRNQHQQTKQWRATCESTRTRKIGFLLP